jgi:hypothetical protein
MHPYAILFIIAIVLIDLGFLVSIVRAFLRRKPMHISVKNLTPRTYKLKVAVKPVRVGKLIQDISNVSR